MKIFWIPDNSIRVEQYQYPITWSNESSMAGRRPQRGPFSRGCEEVIRGSVNGSKTGAQHSGRQAASRIYYAHTTHTHSVIPLTVLTLFLTTKTTVNRTEMTKNISIAMLLVWNP